MNKYTLALVGLVLTVLLAACGGADSTASRGAAAGNGELAEVLEVNFAMGNNARTMTYQNATPLVLPDGSVVTQGDLKPTWQHVQDSLGFQLADVAVQDQRATEMVDIAAATNFEQATVFGGNSIAGDLMNYGALGYFINLRDHMDQMPDVQNYLAENPNVATAITAYDGGIYHLPYVAEIDNYARVFAGRPAWVTALLDSDTELEDETHTLEVAYEGYWSRTPTNVIELQNQAAAGGVLDRDTALSVLRSYIAETYPALDRPSDLYLGVLAAYDIDELIALWRVIELSPNTLSKVSTGSVVPNAEISPFFVRRSRYREDVLKLLNYMDGTRVHASDSYQARLFADVDGNIGYTYADDKFLTNLEHIQAWFQEGLIHSEFADLSVRDEYRKSMFFSDDVEGQRQFGFMTYDWIASTTNGSDKIEGILPPVTTISEAGINSFVHYIENTRAIKPDGWSISAVADESSRNAALALFNHMFSPDGGQAQVYSIPDVIVDGELFRGPDGNEYPMFDQWIFDAAGEYKNGDVSGFLRDFMGSLLPIGYQKEIGFEFQYTSPNGLEAWDLYTAAGVLTPSYDAENTFLRMMPPIVSLNEQDLARIGTTAVGEEQVERIFIYIVGGDTAVERASQIGQAYVEAGIETYLDVYQAAYNRMVAN